MTKQIFLDVALLSQIEEGAINGALNECLLNSNLAAYCSCLVIPLGDRNKQRKLFLGSWNVRTLQDSNSNIERRSALICNALNRYKIDIAAICETRLPGTSQMEEIGEGYTIFWTGKSEEEHRQSGVGFAIKSHIA